MKNLYLELKKDQQERFNAFPMFFAFSKDQFKTGMESLGLTEADTDKVYHIGASGYIRKTDSKAYAALNLQLESELNEAIDQDETGAGFIKDMFMYELENHEYSYTGDLEDTLEALGYTYEEIQQDEKLRTGLMLARHEVMAAE